MSMFAERDLRNRQEDIVFGCGEFSVKTDSMIQSAYAERKESSDNPMDRIKYLESINLHLSQEVVRLKEEIKLKELHEKMLTTLISKLEKNTDKLFEIFDKAFNALANK